MATDSYNSQASGLSSLFGSVSNVTTILIFVGTFLVVLRITRRRNGLPPGPLVLPVIGNILSLRDSDILKSLRKLKDKYGDIYAIYIGSQLTVVLNGYDTIHNALVKRGAIFSNRPETTFSREYLGHGIVFGAKHLWKHNRKFTQKALQEFGFSGTAKSIEERINDDVSSLIGVIDNEIGTFDTEGMVNKALGNVVSGIVFGERFDINDPAFDFYMESIREAAKLFAKANVLLEAFPFLRYLPFDVLHLKSTAARKERNMRIYVNAYEDHKAAYKTGNIRDFIDLYISEMEKDETGKFTPRELRGIQGDIVGAGSETSATTIRWLLLYLLNNPDVQCKLHQEIDNVIGKDRKPRLTDRPNLPYVEATICETLRLSSPAPLAIPHTVDHDTEFGGYVIPANTNVLINLGSALTDSLYWEEPYAFRPERFVDSNGNLVLPKQFIPFSIGRRSCIGESLARMEMFLFVTSLLQRYEFLPPEGASPPEPAGTMGLTYIPQSFMIRVVKRA